MNDSYKIHKRYSLESGFIKIEYKFCNSDEYYKFREKSKLIEVPLYSAPLCYLMKCEFKSSFSGCIDRDLPTCTDFMYQGSKLFSYSSKIPSLFISSLLKKITTVS